jgi:tetratricopeptide (TPR) repeat protein
MKKTMKKPMLTGMLSLALMFGGSTAFSQCKEVIWPENPEMKAKAEESKVLYEDALRAGNVKHAEAPLNWLLANVPKFHSSLYINGAEVFDKLATQEKDPTRKKVYVDSLMIVYDMRIQNCGDEANVMNRKALSFLKYNANDKPAETLAMMDKAFELNGNNIMDGSIVPYMQVVRLNALKLKNMTDEQVLQRYDKLMSIVDYKIQKAQSEGKPIDKLKKIKEDLDVILISIVKVDCAFVKKNLAPKFEQNPNDIELAKKIFTFMLKDKCTDDPLWLRAAEAVHNDPKGEKDCGLAKNLGIIYISKENFSKAEELLKEAQGICTDAPDKAEILLYLGTLESKKGNRTGARDLYRQALSTDASVAKQAYEKIGDLYFNSFNDCAKKVNQADDRLVYLVAYDYYQKAGDGSKMSMAKQAFPSKEEIFLVNYQAGTTKNVGCWINENTTIRTRD